MNKKIERYLTQRREYLYKILKESDTNDVIHISSIHGSLQEIDLIFANFKIKGE